MPPCSSVFAPAELRWFALQILRPIQLPELRAILSVKRTLSRRLYDLKEAVDEFLIGGPVISPVAVDQPDDVQATILAIIADTVNLADLVPVLPGLWPKPFESQNRQRPKRHANTLSIEGQGDIRIETQWSHNGGVRLMGCGEFRPPGKGGHPRGGRTPRQSEPHET